MPAGLWSRLTTFLKRWKLRHSRRHSQSELLARTEEFNRNADAYWKAIGRQDGGRNHVLNRPFSGPTAAVDVYRLGLLMEELRLGPGLDVLDFGAGTCWLSSCLNRMGCRTVAVDVSQAALDLGRQLFALDRRHHEDLSPRFLSYDGHTLPLMDDSVDRIACFDAFHHVPNQDELLREMYRVLRPGGRAVMAEPGEGHSHAGSSAFDESAFEVLENDFDILDVERRARRAGFSDVRLKPYLDPTVDTISASAYVGIGGLRSALKMSTLRAGLGVSEALRNSFRTCAIVVLTKGTEMRDSRCPGLLRARMRLVAPSAPLRGYCGTAVQARMRLKNVGDTLWRHEADPAGGTVLLGSHLLDSAGHPLHLEYLRVPLPHDVGPGREVEVVMAVPLPPKPGQFTLRIDPVDENVIWFSQAGSTPLDVALEAVQPEEDRSYRCAITLRPGRAATRLPAGSRTRMHLRVVNVGSAPWPCAETPGPEAIRLGGKLLDGTGELLDQDFARADLPHAMAPGEACDVLLEFSLPGTPGPYAVKVDLVREQVCWFEQLGSRPLVVELVATADLPDSIAPGILRAELDLLRPEPGAVRALPGEDIEILVRAKNIGNTLWRSAEDRVEGHVRLGAKLVSADGSRDYWRAPISADIPPGTVAEIQARMPAPAGLGDYTVVLDLVDEGIAWFQHEGSRVVSFPMQVTADKPTSSRRA
jgi:SAM-dependent methyltransferase